MKIKYFSSLASFPAPAVQLARKIQLPYQLLSLEKEKPALLLSLLFLI